MGLFTARPTNPPIARPLWTSPRLPGSGAHGVVPRHRACVHYAPGRTTRILTPRVTDLPPTRSSIVTFTT